MLSFPLKKLINFFCIVKVGDVFDDPQCFDIIVVIWIIVYKRLPGDRTDYLYFGMQIATMTIVDYMKEEVSYFVKSRTYFQLSLLVHQNEIMNKNIDYETTNQRRQKSNTSGLLQVLYNIAYRGTCTTSILLFSLTNITSTPIIEPSEKIIFSTVGDLL